MSLLKSVYRFRRQADGKFRVPSLRGALNHWRIASGLRKDFPDSWRWLLLSSRVHGFLALSEGDQLFKMARDYTPDNNPVVVEIGSWKGKSSILLAGGLVGKENPRLFCIDPFGPSDDPEYRKTYGSLLTESPGDLEQVFRSNISICGLDHIAIPLRGLSSEHAAQWTQPIDLLFIDGNHEYEAVLEDFMQWSRFVRPGGVVALHDVGEYYEGPTRVVSEHLQAPRFGPVHRLEVLAWAVKKQDSPSVASGVGRFPLVNAANLHRGAR